MGRPSKLSDNQWAEIERRLAAGEKIRPLAREFGVSEAAIRGRGLSARVESVQIVAKQLAEAESNFAALPLASQITARSLADDLKAISGNLASAARHGSATAVKLSKIAAEQVDQINTADPDISTSPHLRNIIVLHGAANEASKIATNLLSANRDAARAAFTEPPELPAPGPQSSVEVGDAMAVYQRMLNGG